MHGAGKFAATEALWEGHARLITLALDLQPSARGVVRMNKQRKGRAAFLAGLSLWAFMAFTGCESKGPAQKAGESIDKGIQDTIDAISPPGPAQKVGRGLDKALEP